MTNFKRIYTEDQRDAVCKGEICPACLGKNIKWVNPDDMYNNSAFDCKDCGAQWEGY